MGTFDRVNEILKNEAFKSKCRNVVAESENMEVLKESKKEIDKLIKEKKG